MADFPGHRHEDDADSGKVWRPSVTFVLQTVLRQDEERSGEQKVYFKKRKRVISKEAVGHSSGHFKRHFGHKYH